MLYLYLVAVFISCFSKGFCWLNCSDVSFCVRIRQEQKIQNYVVDPESVVLGNTSVRASLVSDGKLVRELSITGLVGDILRVTIDDPGNPRHRVNDVLQESVVELPLLVALVEGVILINNGDASAVVFTSPFTIKFYNGDTITAVINQKNRLVLEDEPEGANAVDVSFPDTKVAYGIPQHADSLSLRDTVQDGEPYRLFNIDNAGYEIYSTQAIYGSIPVLYAHSDNKSAGLFWLNSAQTFVDINKGDVGIDALFLSESGVIDFFILPGLTLKAAVRQYSALTGVAPIPPYFALGYHQSRNYYETTEDLMGVVNNLTNSNFPVDVVYLDGDSQEYYKFLFNHTAHPDPIGLQDYLSKSGKWLVVAIEPFTIVDENYTVYTEALSNDYFIKTSGGEIYSMNALRARYHFMDFFDPEIRDYWSSLYGFDRYTDSTEILFIWNDLNEPTVFGEDVDRTMPKDNRHYGGWLHRDVHNQFGFYEIKGTYEGLVKRSNGRRRGLVLTRSHFAGSQRYAHIWTGDNNAWWNHLQAVSPMCLSEALAGISFCGSDIGGFFFNPSEELLERWYQVAIWTSFFRQHSDKSTDRREPYLFSEGTQSLIRRAIQIRYFHLPYWYTIFYEHYRSGEPVIKPLTLNYQSDENLLEIDNQWLVGDNILVRPVMEEGSSAVSVYFPGGPDVYWYDIENTLMYNGNGWYNIYVNISTTNYFYRSGSIVPRKDTIRLSTAEASRDPFNLYVFLNNNGEAYGTLYVDDGITFEYQSGNYAYLALSFANNTLSIVNVEEETSFNGTIEFGNAYVYRPPSEVKKAVAVTTNSKHFDLDIVYASDNKYLQILNKPGIRFSGYLQITLTY